MDSEIPNRFYRISIKGLILDETRTKFLIVQEDDGEWELPRGGIDWNELPETCLRREIQEEMGLMVLTMNPTPSYFLTDKARSNAIYIANVLYEITLSNLDFTPSDECVAIKFVTPDEARSLKTFPNVQALANMFDPKNHVIK